MVLRAPPVELQARHVRDLEQVQEAHVADGADGPDHPQVVRGEPAAAPRLQPVVDPKHHDLDRIAPPHRLLEELEIGPGFDIVWTPGGLDRLEPALGKEVEQVAAKDAYEQLGQSRRIAKARRRGRRSGAHRDRHGSSVSKGRGRRNRGAGIIPTTGEDYDCNRTRIRQDQPSMARGPPG